MSETEFLNLTRSATEHQVTWFAQMLTINFAMVVAIYYFLHQARMALKFFTFFAYTIGMLVLLGEILGETNVKAGVIEALRAIPAAQLSRPSVRYLAFLDSWVWLVTAVTFNLSIWLLWLGVFYLLFFSQKHWTSNQAMKRIATD